MKLNPWLTRSLLSLLITATVVGSAHATCWICLFDGGSGQYYCQSSTGVLPMSCTPNWGEYCTLGGSGWCEEDGCQCARYPALPPDGHVKRAKPLSAGLLLLHGRSPEDHAALLAALPATPFSFDIGDDVVTPDLAAMAIGMSAEKLELSAHAAATKQGPINRRLLGENGAGLLVDARPRGTDQHLMISQLYAGSLVESSHEIELPPNRAALCRVRMGEEIYACVIWARSIEAEADADRHQRFSDAASAYPVRNLVAMQADSPDTRLITYAKRPTGPSPWGRMASFFR